MANTGPNNAALAAVLASGVALGGVLASLLTSSQRQYGGFDEGESRRPRGRPAPRPRRGGRGHHDPDSEDDDVHDAGTAQMGRARSSKPQRKTAGSAVEFEDDDMSFGLKAGFSMCEARKMAAERSEEALNRMPEEVLRELQRGNARFWTGKATRPEKSAFERRALISKQFPSTAILGCSDSRVPVEIVFDQGLGDMFVIRVAGNCLDTSTQASLQYAVHHLKVKVLIVLGHEGCGAVKASQLPEDKIKDEPEELGTFLRTMKGQLDAGNLGRIQDVKAADREAVTANVRNQVEMLMQDDSIMDKDPQQPAIARGPSRGVLTRGPSLTDDSSGRRKNTAPGS